MGENKRDWFWFWLRKVGKSEREKKIIWDKKRKILLLTSLNSLWRLCVVIRKISCEKLTIRNGLCDSFKHNGLFEIRSLEWVPLTCSDHKFFIRNFANHNIWPPDALKESWKKCLYLYRLTKMIVDIMDKMTKCWFAANVGIQNAG